MREGIRGRQLKTRLSSLYFQTSKDSNGGKGGELNSKGMVCRNVSSIKGTHQGVPVPPNPGSCGQPLPAPGQPGRKRQWCYLTGAVALSRTWPWPRRKAAQDVNSSTPSPASFCPNPSSSQRTLELRRPQVAALGTQSWWRRVEVSLEGTSCCPPR